jgi:hypothetical protein
MCDPQYGAVEDFDWRDNSSWGYSAAGEGLRLARQMRVYQTLYQTLQPDNEPDLRGNFYLKNVGPYAPVLLAIPTCVPPADQTAPWNRSLRGKLTVWPLAPITNARSSRNWNGRCGCCTHRPMGRRPVAVNSEHRTTRWPSATCQERAHGSEHSQE